MGMVKRFDIILVYVFFRRHNYYLNIMKELGKDYKVGILVSEQEKGQRTQQTDKLFKKLLQDYGAEFIQGESLECNVLVIPNYVYTEDFVKFVRSSVHFKKAIAPSGLSQGKGSLELLHNIGVTMVLPYSRGRFFENLQGKDEEEFIENNFDVVSIGNPCGRYPAIQIEPADYMIAYPTHLSVTKDTHVVLLKNICSLLEKLKGKRIYLKTHNVRDYGNDLFSESAARKLRLFPGFLLTQISRAIEVILSLLPVNPSSLLYNKIKSFQIHALNAIIAKVTIPLRKITPYANFGIEHFLPYAKEGLITGKTSCVWFALMGKLAVYNCDSYSEIAKGQNVLDNMRSFGVAPCDGELKFDERCFGSISNEDRDADMIEVLKKLLK